MTMTHYPDGSPSLIVAPHPIYNPPRGATPNYDFEWPVKGGAYIIMETKIIWFWQRRRYERNGWCVSPCPMGRLRFQVERCIG